MKRTTVSLIFAGSIFLGGCLQGDGSYFAPTAAVVNGEKVPESKISFQLRQIVKDPESAARFKGPQGAPNRLDASRDILNEVIRLELAQQYARANGIKVTREEVDAQIKQLEGRYGSREAFQKVVREQGLTMDEVVDFLTEQTLFNRVGEEVTKSARPNEQQMMEFYEANKNSFLDQVHAAHILICAELTNACAPGPDDEATAKSITSRARAGEDFAKLAAEFSKDPGTAQKGGDLGFFARGRMAPEFEQVAFALGNPGDVSDPVKTQFGYHVIKLIQKGKTFEQAKPDIQSALGRQRQQQAYEAWFTDQLRRARIRVDPKYGRFDSASLQVIRTTQARNATRPQER